MRLAGLMLVVVALGGCAESNFSGQTGSTAKKETAKPQPATPTPAPATANATPTPVPTNTPASAVTQGSFTVWAEPENPHCIPYKIHIQVKLPSTTTSYTRQDLTGNLVGTDGYVQDLSKNSLWTVLGGGQFKYSGSTAELVVPVPAAENLVKDTINVQSKLLNESQTLAVLFGNVSSKPCGQNGVLFD